MPKGYCNKLPTFDCRVFNVPNKQEAVNHFMWREWDATKNSITSAANSVYSHSELQDKNSSQKQEMLFQKGINWNDYPAEFKRGTYIQRKVVERAYLAEELESLPPKHHARLSPDLVVSRMETKVLDMPPLAKVVNQVEVVFNGAAPAVAGAVT